MTIAKLIQENFEKVWKIQRKAGRTEELTRLLLAKLVEVAPDMQVEADFAILPNTPDPIALPLTLEQEAAALRKEYEQMKRDHTMKYGTEAEKAAIIASSPKGLTIQEISQLYSVSPNTIRNYIEELEELGYRYTGERGQRPLVYSEVSVERLAASKEWVKRLSDQIQVVRLQQKLEQQQDTEVSNKDGTDGKV